MPTHVGAITWVATAVVDESSKGRVVVRHQAVGIRRSDRSVSHDQSAGPIHRVLHFLATHEGQRMLTEPEEAIDPLLQICRGAV